MTDLVMNYTVNPFWKALKSFGKGMMNTQARIGRARAAAQLSAMGYHKEAKAVMMQEIE